jgi:methyl-accepting chemotaxis protein
MNTLRSKLLVSILTTVILLLGMSFFAIGYLANTNLTMLMEEDTKHQAEKNAEAISSLFVESYASTYANAVHQEYLKKTGQTDRESLKRYLANYLEKHENFYAIWTQFEPNAWDGRDAEFAGKPGYSDIGLNSPWVYRKDGQVIIDTEGSYAETEEYYVVPKTTKKPYVTMPYQEETTADTVTMMSTITIPLFDTNGTLIGVTGTDIALSTFQEIIANLKFFESGYGTIISSDGTLVAHPRVDLIGKDVKELDTEEANKLLFDTIERGVVNSTKTFSTVTNQKVLRLFAPLKSRVRVNAGLLGEHPPARSQCNTE